MHSANVEAPDQRIKLLIVCLRTELARVRLIVNRHAHDRWESEKEIQVLPVADAIRETASMSWWQGSTRRKPVLPCRGQQRPGSGNSGVHAGARAAHGWAARP